MLLALNINKMDILRTSIKVVLDKLLRDPLFNNINIEAVADYCIEFMQIVGVPDMLEEKLFEGTVEQFRCLLPNDYVETIQVLINNVPARYATDTFHNFYEDVKGSQPKEYMPPSADYSFKMAGDYIYTSIEKGKIKMVYRAIELDEEGYPTIPNDETFIRALRMYIEVAWIRTLWRAGKVSDKVYQDAQQSYAFAVGACETSMRRLDLSKAESFYNSYKTLIVRANEFYHRFRNLGTKEVLKTIR